MVYEEQAIRDDIINLSAFLHACLFVQGGKYGVPYKPHCVPSVMNIMMAGGRTQMPTRKSARPRERMNWLVTVRSFGVVSTAMMIRALPS